MVQGFGGDGGPWWVLRGKVVGARYVIESRESGYANAYIEYGALCVSTHFQQSTSTQDRGDSCHGLVGCRIHRQFQTRATSQLNHVDVALRLFPNPIESGSKELGRAYGESYPQPTG
jgi:hypothetical protein